MDSSSQLFDRPSAALDGPAKDITLQQFSEPFKFLEQNPLPPRADPLIRPTPLSSKRLEGSGVMRQFVASNAPC
jgi:hypothetical protein